MIVITGACGLVGRAFVKLWLNLAHTWWQDIPQADPGKYATEGQRHERSMLGTL